MSSAQFNENDYEISLNKYSYMMVGFAKDGTGEKIIPLGTCFFIRKDGKLYMITALHNITGINCFDKSLVPNQFDAIGFRYLNNKTNEISVSRIDISSFKHHLPTDYFYKLPDAVGLPMTDPVVEPFINTLDTNMLSPIDGEIVENKVIAVTYPYIDDKQYTKEMEAVHYQGDIVKSIDVKHNYPINDNIYFTATPKSIQGMSGAPVYKKYISSIDGTVQFAFSGLIFGKNDNLNYAYIVKSEAIIYY